MERMKLTINILTGLHLRPAGVLCKSATEFSSTITLKRGDNTANAKSILGVLSTCAKYGDEIELICDGKDEKEAMQVLSDLILIGLGDTQMKK